MTQSRGRIGRVLTWGSAVAVWVLLSNTLLPAVAVAQTADAVAVQEVPSSVSVEVRVVHATRDDDRIDPQLATLAPLFRHQPFTGFRLLRLETMRLGSNETTGVQVSSERSLEVTLLRHDARQARIRVRLLRDKEVLTDTTVTTYRNRTFMIAGPKHAGGILILPLTVRY